MNRIWTLQGEGLDDIVKGAKELADFINSSEFAEMRKRHPLVAAKVDILYKMLNQILHEPPLYSVLKSNCAGYRKLLTILGAKEEVHRIGDIINRFSTTAEERKICIDMLGLLKDAGALEVSLRGIKMSSDMAFRIRMYLAIIDQENQARLKKE